MVDVSRTFTVNRSTAEVAAYLRDFANAVEWDPGTVECRQISDGPIGLGTRWHNESKLFGISTQLTYELVRDDPDHVVFSGSNKTATTSDDLTLHDRGDGTTEITYRALVDFHRFAFIGEPLFTFIFNRLAESVPQQLKRVLGG